MLGSARSKTLVFDLAEPSLDLGKMYNIHVTLITSIVILNILFSLQTVVYNLKEKWVINVLDYHYVLIQIGHQFYPLKVVEKG